MSEAKKYYWLKLDKNFFKRHDIRIVESMPNGKAYILLYLKLLLESIDHEGLLRFNESIPYNEDMIATITDTNIDIVRSGLKLFSDLKLLDVTEDKTIHMVQTVEMLGESTSTHRVKAFRERQKLKQLPHNETLHETLHETELEIEKELEIDIELDNKAFNVADEPATTRKKFVKPTLNQIKDYQTEYGSNVSVEEFYDYFESKGWLVGKSPMKDWKSAFRNWVRKGDSFKSSKPNQEKTNKRGLSSATAI